MFNPDVLKEIKILKQNDRQKIILAEDSNGKKYLKREIENDKRELYKSLQKIKHPNIPEIYFVSFDEKTTVIEEYVDGKSIDDLIHQDIKISKKQIYSIVNQVLSALAKLHESNIIHRDVKPDNILIDISNHVWLIDYDIARIYREEKRKDTDIKGTFGYAPIEQYGMLPTDSKTDIYAFGATLKTILVEFDIKGFLHKIADKCKKLDPTERYNNANEVKRAINIGRIKYPLMCAFAIIVIMAFVMVNIFTEVSFQNTIEDNDDIVQQTINNEEPTEEDSPTSTDDNEDIIKTEKFEESPNVEVIPEEIGFEGTFSGFSSGQNELLYQNYSYYPNVRIFTTDSPWEHIIFVDDMNKTGRLKLGKNETIINADMTLSNGNLTVNLNDGKGNMFSHQFRYNGQYEYNMNYTNDIRKNADIICYDFNGDGGTELLIGLNEGIIGVSDEMFYNNFNYCIAWCIKYDENIGFTLCDGDMFSKDYSFWINDMVRKLNVSWEDIGDVTGYKLVDDKIEPVF